MISIGQKYTPLRETWIQIVCKKDYLSASVDDKQKMIVPRGGGYSDILYIRSLINIFWGMKTLWIIFWGHHKIGLYLGVISMHLWVFSEGQGTDWYRYFWGLLQFQIFFGCVGNS